MPNFAPHIRMTALGTLGNNEQEKFAYGLSLARDNWPNNFTDVLPELMGDLQDIAADVVAFHARPQSLIHPLAILRSVKFAAIRPNGTYEGDAIEINVADTPGGSDFSPALRGCVLPQQSLAVSLGTGERSASKRGRFYPPMTCVELEDYLIAKLNYAESLRGSARQLIEDINNAPGVDDGLGTALTVVIASGTAGINTPVTEVRVGRVVDTVRSRRRSIDEAYTAPLEV